MAGVHWLAFIVILDLADTPPVLEQCPVEAVSFYRRPHPSYRTSEPWLVHDVFFLLAVTELYQALR